MKVSTYLGSLVLASLTVPPLPIQAATIQNYF